jgi:hypothetical protein
MCGTRQAVCAWHQITIDSFKGTFIWRTVKPDYGDVENLNFRDSDYAPVMLSCFQS